MTGRHLYAILSAWIYNCDKYMGKESLTMGDNINATVYLKDEIGRCESLEELEKTVFPLIRSQQEEWTAKIDNILDIQKCTQGQFADLCGVSRQTVNKWCSGAIPKNRETFIRIGLAAGYNLEKMNRFLQRYGRYPALYAKSLEDCVCIFVVNHSYEDKAVEKYNEIIGVIKRNIVKTGSSCQEDIDTLKFNEKLSKVNSEDELKKFIYDNTAVFLTAYNKLYAMIKMYLVSNNHGIAYKTYDIAEAQNWSSSLRHCVSEINQSKWYPTRNKIISLGLHLSMDHDQIDEMLTTAYMEKLCAKNIFESVIMFILDDANLRNMTDRKSEDFDPDALCRYAREILEKLKMPDFTDFITELPEAEYD